VKVLIITNLFPNRKEPTRAQYNRQQFRELSGFCELKIVAPLPFFKYSAQEVPGIEIIEGIEVFHPRYLVIPKVLRSLYGFFFFFGIISIIKVIYKTFKFDAILGSWVYPDGFASALAAKILNKPLVIKVHGSDINIYTRYFFRRKMITYALRKASRVIVVTGDLKKRVAALGIPQEKIEVIPNGIDIGLFQPLDKIECRKKLKLPVEKKIILYTGNLEKVKGVDVLVSAMQNLNKNACLALVGDGKLKNSLKLKVKSLSLENRITFAGVRLHSEIPLWMNACDVFCLPSRNEGCPNVVLEALACGRPVVASMVGGVPEIINSDELGLLVEPKNPKALAEALANALEKTWDPNRIRQAMAKYSWDKSAKEIKDTLDCAAGGVAAAPKGGLRQWIKSIVSRIAPKNMVAWSARHPRGIALTFDDGPNAEFTPKILDILKEKDIKATFFVIGKEVEQNKDLTGRIAREGHNIGMHSYSHRRFGKLASGEKKKEIAKAKSTINKEIGVESKLFRPPQGSISLSQLLYCLKNRITTIMWSINSMDYQNRGTRNIINNTVENDIRGGDIILLHDDNEFTLQALPKIIEGIRGKDFDFVTVEELLK
jgi:glycosyltransferase involved in cell wall biosynthesis